MKLWRHDITIYALLSFSIAYAPSPLRFVHLQSVKGLRNRSIIFILQDDAGFIWIGTQVCLFRFDGYDLKIYKGSLLNRNSLSDNNIRALTKDSLSNLLIGTQGGGLNKLNLKRELFTHYINDSKNPDSIS